MVVVVNGVVVVVHISIVYTTVELVSKSSMLCTMLHGAIVPVLLGNGVVVVDETAGDDRAVTLRNSRRLTQNTCVPAATTDALHISRHVIRMLTIRKTGFSAPRM